MRHARNCGAEWFKWLRPAAAGLIKVSHLTYFLGDSDLSVHSVSLVSCWPRVSKEARDYA